MKRFSIVTTIFALLFSTVLVSCSSNKSEAEKTVDTFLDLLKQKNFARAWDMVDKESQEIVGQERFLEDAKYIGLNTMFLKSLPVKMNTEGTKAIIETEYTGQKVAMNNLQGAKIIFYVNKNGEKWELNLKERIDKIKEEQKKDAIEIPINPELIETAKLYKDKIEVKDLRNGEVEFANGMSQYMMDATVKNNTDKSLSYVGVLVKFMDDKDEKVLFEKTFFVIYTRQIEEIYPIAPGEEKSIIIPGYDAGDIDGNWTGKLKWEVNAVKVATPAEMIKIEDLNLPKK
ncbi:MAG TPA: hypothetical protein PKG52_03280 [bacterium]|mgnify:CR=1 FL=1|nr:hypothetical protein [bacterium]HPS29642.1 hypothetical protein [bacterium]